MWFAKFKAEDFSLEMGICSRIPSQMDEDVLKAEFRGNTKITTRELVEEIKVSTSTVHKDVAKWEK